jgi:hypothetical protein
MIAELQNIARLTGAPPYTSYPTIPSHYFQPRWLVDILQGGAPPSYKWVIIPLTIDISHKCVIIPINKIPRYPYR